MENPLSEDQINELNKIAKLPPEEQKVKLQEFLKTLTPEQIEFLKKQQAGGQCPFCLIAEGKIPSKVIYEDEKVLAILDIKPANEGHVIVLPKKHYFVLGQMPEEEVMYLFKVANKVATVLYEALNAEGTNIFVANGPVAGQMAEHVLVHVIPRFKDDGVAFAWKGKEVTDEQLKAVQDKLVGKIAFRKEVVKKEEPKEIPEEANEERVPDFS